MLANTHTHLRDLSIETSVFTLHSGFSVQSKIYANSEIALRLRKVLENGILYCARLLTLGNTIKGGCTKIVVIMSSYFQHI